MTKCPICKTNAVVLKPIDGTEVVYMCGDCASGQVLDFGYEEKEDEL